MRTDDFASRGGFSERFFFGEEDFELALWMRERGLAGLCLTSAVVRHKVSASFNAAAGAHASRKVFVYYLNRFIHMRLRIGRWPWLLWSAAYLPYVVILLWRSGAVGAALYAARGQDIGGGGVIVYAVPLGVGLAAGVGALLPAWHRVYHSRRASARGDK